MLRELSLLQLTQHDGPASILTNSRQRQLAPQRFTAQVSVELLAVVTKIQREARRVFSQPQAGVCCAVKETAAPSSYR